MTPDVEKKSRLPRSDWATYRRLMSYLRGTHWIILAVFLCMILEAVFTASSIGLAKPLLDVAVDNPIFKPHDPAKPTAKSKKAPGFFTAEADWLKAQRDQIRNKIEPPITRLQTEAKTNSHVKFRIMRWIIAAMLVFGLFMVVSSFAVGYLSSYLATRAVQKLRNHLFTHMVQLDLQYFSNHSTGQSMSLVIQDVQAVDGALDMLFSSVLKNPVKMITFTLVMVSISPSLTLITFLVIPFIGGAIYLLGKKVRRVSQKVQKVKAMLSSILEEAFTGMRVIKGYNMEMIEARRFEKKTDQVFRMGMKTTTAEEIGSGLTQFLGLATVAVVFLIGTYFVVVRHDLDGPAFILFTGLLTQVFRPLKGASKVSSKIQRGLAGCDRVFAVLDQFPKIVDKPGAIALTPLKKALSFNDVTFHYDRTQPPQLKNINLSIPAGSAIALVGETGSGKSTMANLIPRFFDVSDGSLTYDGLDLRDAQIKSLRSQLAIVTQDVVLFDDSVGNNIAYGLQRKVAPEDIEAAAKAARAHEFIMKLPNGYKTTIGSRGSRLSGGERQRLAIARAILKDAPILILDEATSALDSETESLIQEALTNLIKGRTTIIIAHRLSTIRNCDRIYVLDNGRIIEEGSHAELLNREGRYARFHNYQFAEPVGK